MFDKDSSSFTQDRIDIWLVQINGYFDESVGGPDLQLLYLPAAGRETLFNPEDCPTCPPHHMAKFAFCLRQSGHVLSLPAFGSEAERPAGQRQAHLL